MQKNYNLILYMILSAIIFCISCTKDDTSTVCETFLVNTNFSNVDSCHAGGSISVNSPIGNNFSYSLNGTIYQPSPIFNNIKPGNYVVSVKNEKNCVSVASVVVETKSAGILFTNVKMILANNCVRCHGGVNPQAGINFDLDCDIVQKWDRIKARAIDGNPSPMPSRGLIPEEERNIIMAWIDAGHQRTN